MSSCRLLLPLGLAVAVAMGPLLTFSAGGLRAAAPSAVAGGGLLRGAARASATARPTRVLLAVGIAATGALSGLTAAAWVRAKAAGGCLRATTTRGQRVSLRAKSYWEGEWICADCGYIYNERAFGQKFEDLQAGFKCPNCAAPRRRFARKLGDKIGTTLDGGDTPILLFSAGALVVVLLIAYFALQ